MIIAGIDYSMNSPAMVLFNTETNKPIGVYAVKQKKRMVSHDPILTLFEPVTDYKNDIDRFDQLANKFVDVLKEHNVTEVGLEGYAYRSVGAVYTIGECIGMLKYNLLKNNINLTIFQPTEVKKHMTGKGNANKTAMFNSYTSRDDYIDFLKILNLEKRGENIPGPIDDIVDAITIAELTACHLAPA